MEPETKCEDPTTMCGGTRLGTPRALKILSFKFFVAKSALNCTQINATVMGMTNAFVNLVVET